MTRDQRAAGFTLLEMVISIAILTPIVIAVMSTSALVATTANANDREAEVMDHNRVLVERMSELFRPAVLSTLRVRATQADVDEYQLRADAELLLDPLATPYVPGLGDWIPPPSVVSARPNLQFRCALGQLSLNADAMTTVREFELLLDPGEIDNDIDDDGDGLVDEGRLEFLYEGARLTLVSDVEEIAFSVLPKRVQVALTLARRDGRGNVHRARFVHRFFPRNN